MHLSVRQTPIRPSVFLTDCERFFIFLWENSKFCEVLNKNILTFNFEKKELQNTSGLFCLFFTAFVTLNDYI